MRVILVRHGQTDWNEEGVFRGRIDIPLNTRGEKQASIIARTMRRVPLAAVYSSPLKRAYATAVSIARYHHMDVQICNELVDIDFGEWQGLKRSDVVQRYPDIFRVWEVTPEKVEIPGAETLDEVRERLMRGLNAILSEYPEETVVLVSHGLTNKVLLCAVLGLDNSHFWKIKQDNGALNVFKYTGAGSKLFLMNETTHLRTVAEIIEDMKSIENPLG